MAASIKGRTASGNLMDINLSPIGSKTANDDLSWLEPSSKGSKSEKTPTPTGTGAESSAGFFSNPTSNSASVSA